MPDPVYYYECQERAMAPGIGDGWPEFIKAPHTKHARLVRIEGDPHVWRDALERIAASAQHPKHAAYISKAEIARIAAEAIGRVVAR